MIYKPNSPESFAVCMRIREEWKSRAGMVMEPLAEKYSVRPTRKRRPHTRRKKPSLPAEQLLDVYRMIDLGKSGREISEAVGKSMSTIWRLKGKRDIWEPYAMKVVEMRRMHK